MPETTTQNGPARHALEPMTATAANDSSFSLCTTPPRGSDPRIFPLGPHQLTERQYATPAGNSRVVPGSRVAVEPRTPCRHRADERNRVGSHLSDSLYSPAHPECELSSALALGMMRCDGSMRPPLRLCR